MTATRHPGGALVVVLRRNIAWVGLSYVGGAVAGFVAQLVLARVLGQAVFGQYFAAWSLVSILAAAYALGHGSFLVRELSHTPLRLAEILGELLAIKVAATVIVTIASVTAGALLRFSGRELAVTALLALMLGFNAISQPYRAGLQGVERIDVAARITLTNALVSAAGMVALVVIGQGLVVAVAFSAVISAVLIPVSARALHRQTGVYGGRLRRTVWPTLCESFPFTAIVLLTMATSYADALIIRALLGPEATGAYGAAFRIFMVLQFLPAAYFDSCFRSLSDFSRTDRAAFRRLVDKSAAGLFVLALPLAIGGAVLAHDIMTFVFGGSFHHGAVALAPLMLSLVLSFPQWILLGAITAGERPAYAIGILALALAGNVAANLILVPSYGIEASAWITLVTDAFIAAAAHTVLRGRGLNLRWPALGAPAVIGAVACGAAALALRGLPLPVPVAAGAAVYVAALWLTHMPERLGLPPIRQLFGAQAP
jgi:O-antigen/teichoic acid export membrane protein